MPRHGLLLLLLTCTPAGARWRTSKVGDRIVTDGSRLPMATGQTVFSLARRAVALQESWSSTAGTDAYALGDDEPCAWANWLMPERLLIGESPIGASAAETQERRRVLLAVGVDCFARIQSDESTEPSMAAGAAALDLPPSASLEYTLAAERVPTDGLGENATLLLLLDAMLQHYESGGVSIYVHSEHGRGRAALVGACMLSLLRPKLDAKRLLALVQKAHDARGGATASSPTYAQGRFVSSFVSSVRAAGRLQNDMDMVMAGLPKAFL